MKIVTSGTMAHIDKIAQEEFLMPSLMLMENAGLKACALLKEKIIDIGKPQQKLVFVAGKGNNGGDALVMARQFHMEGLKDITIILAAGPPPPESDPGINLAICNKLGLPLIDYTKTPDKALGCMLRADWLFDGIAGTGIRGEIRGQAAAMIKVINESPGRTIAIDLPSGLGDEFKPGYLCVRAEHTLTMGLPKLCLYLPAGRPFCGLIHVINLGFPPALVTDPALPGDFLQEQDLPGLNRPMAAESYKNSRGHLAVFAGAPGTTGAAWLSSTAAAHSKAGLVTCFADNTIYPRIVSAYKAVMVRPWAPLDPLPDLDSFTAMLIGPGWGVTDERQQVLVGLLEQDLPCLIDADGLTLLTRMLKQKKIDLKGRCVLSPHPGEFSRLTGLPVAEIMENPVSQAIELSSRLNAVVILKSHLTCITSPEGRYTIFDGMNPALGTAGSGDVLSGVVSALMAGGMAPYAAARLGVLVHSCAGRQAYAHKGWFTADELIPYLARVLQVGDHPVPCMK